MFMRICSHYFPIRY